MNPVLGLLVLRALVDVAAVNRLRAMSHDLASAADWKRIAETPSYAALLRRRYPPDGDVHRYVAHGDQPCPRPPCWCCRPARPAGVPAAAVRRRGPDPGRLDPVRRPAQGR